MGHVTLPPLFLALPSFFLLFRAQIGYICRLRIPSGGEISSPFFSSPSGIANSFRDILSKVAKKVFKRVNGPDMPLDDWLLNGIKMEAFLPFLPLLVFSLSLSLSVLFSVPVFFRRLTTWENSGNNTGSEARIASLPLFSLSRSRKKLELKRGVYSRLSSFSCYPAAANDTRGWFHNRMKKS